MKVSTGKIHTIMKTKNIFLTAISALFICAACTEEKIIDEPGVSGKGDLVIELSPSSVITKADPTTNSGYQYATEEELTVNNCWIFAVQDNTIKARQYFSSPTQTTGPYKDKDDTYTKGYQVTLNGLNYGTYDFWVVANPTGGADDSRYTTCVDLDDLKKIIEGSTTYNDAFPNPSQLIKVGNKESEFDRANNTIIVPLTQLAARVQLKIEIDLKWDKTGSYYEYFAPGSEDSSVGDNGLLDKRGLEQVLGKSVNNSDGVALKDIDVEDYTYFGYGIKFENGNSKGISVENLNVKKITVYEGYALKDLNFVINNIRVNSLIGLPQVTDYVTPSYDRVTFKSEGSIVSYICSFYTYGKDCLDVDLEGTLLNGQFREEQKGTSSGYFINDANGTNTNNIKNGIYPEAGGTLTFVNGWQGNIDNCKFVLITNKEDLALDDEVVPAGGDYKEQSYKQSAQLIPKDGFVNGHYYEGTIRIQSAPVSGQMTVEIDPFKDFGPIDFGFN